MRPLTPAKLLHSLFPTFKLTPVVICEVRVQLQPTTLPTMSDDSSMYREIRDPIVSTVQELESQRFPLNYNVDCAPSIAGTALT